MTKTHLSSHKPKDRSDLHKDVMDLIWKHADWFVDTKLWYSNWLNGLSKEVEDD